MPDAAPAPGIDAGRQTPAHEQLSRALWLRKPGEVFRFVLDPAAEPGLTLERVGQGEALKARLAGLAPGADGGLALVDGGDGLAFFTAAPPQDMLQRLAAWARQAIGAVPALALLADSGAAPLDVDPLDDAAAQAYVPQGEAVVYDPALWDGLLEPDVATTAAALGAITPGERMWFWLAEDETDLVPLIVQPVAWDPNHDRTTWLVDRNTERGAGEGITGTATLCDDGTIQLLGTGLYRDMLTPLARWVARHQAAHPALGRLVDCQLLVASGATVEAVIVDPALWRGIAHDPVQGTLAATAAVLGALPVGGECWFWITGSPTDVPFLHLVPTDSDPDGAAFRAALPQLYKRFARAFADAICGVVRRPASGGLLFCSADAQAHFAVQVQALLARHAAAFPALTVLAGATIVPVETPS